MCRLSPPLIHVCVCCSWSRVLHFIQDPPPTSANESMRVCSVVCHPHSPCSQLCVCLSPLYVCVSSLYINYICQHHMCVLSSYLCVTVTHLICVSPSHVCVTFVFMCNFYMSMCPLLCLYVPFICVSCVIFMSLAHLYISIWWYNCHCYVNVSIL